MITLLYGALSHHVDCCTVPFKPEYGILAAGRRAVEYCCGESAADIHFSALKLRTAVMDITTGSLLDESKEYRPEL